MKKNSVHAIKIFYTLYLAVMSVFVYRAGVNIYHYPEPELSPAWSFFGSSDWSVLFTHFYLSFLYPVLIAINYVIKSIKGISGNFTSPVLFKRVFSVFRFISTVLILAFSLFAYYGITFIWYRYKILIAWTYLHIYFYLFHFYLIVNVIDIFLKITLPCLNPPKGDFKIT
jgi:hypothetical protein